MMVERVNYKMPRIQPSACSLPSLYKYMRRRKIMSKTGYYLEIKSNGDVSCTKNPSSIYSELLVLSVGPNFVAIVGEEAKRYLAVDERGKVFTALEERKECVFREFLGRNFFTLIRTCYSDAHGRGWYLSINHMGKVRAEKVPYSDEPQLHFIIKVIPKEEKSLITKKDEDQVWKHRDSYKRSSSGSSGHSRNSSPASASSRSEYGSPIGFYDRTEFLSPVSFSERSAFTSPLSPSGRSAFVRPQSLSDRSQYGTPLSFMGNAESPASPTDRSIYGSPISFSGRSTYGSPVSFHGRYDFGSPVSFSGQSEYGTPLSFMHGETVIRSPTNERRSRSDTSSSQASNRSRSSSSDRDSVSSLGKTTSC